ncbi:MAG: CARDB domain-containing protein [Candidatus Omnitrophota bacterium]
MWRKKIFIFLLGFFLSFIGVCNLSGTVQISGSTTINQRSQQTYTVTIRNTTSSPLTNLVLTMTIGPETDVFYVPFSSSLQISSTPTACYSEPSPGATPTTHIWDLNTLCGSAIVLNPADTLTLSFKVQATCNGVAGAMSAHFQYRVAGTGFFEDASFAIQINPFTPAQGPNISITQTSPNVQGSCTDTRQWEVTVTNTGTETAEYVRIEIPNEAITLDNPDWVLYYTCDDETTSCSDKNTRIYTCQDPFSDDAWINIIEIDNLAPGESRTFPASGTLNMEKINCSSGGPINARARWRCGVFGEDISNYCFFTATAPPLTFNLPDLQIESITPHLTCNADGTLSGTVTVRVKNAGSGTSSGAFKVRVTDGTWTEEVNAPANPIAPGAYVDITVPKPTWNTCSFPLTALADSTDVVCECNEENNTREEPITIPDIRITADTLTLTCQAAGNVKISGRVTLTNAGCGVLTGNIPVRFSAYSELGAGGTLMSQWTQTLPNVSIAAGATQSFDVSSPAFSGNGITHSPACHYSIKVEANVDRSVSEFNCMNNTYITDKTVEIPDIVVQSVDASLTCTPDGKYQINGRVTLKNSGCGPGFKSNVHAQFAVYPGTGCNGSPLFVLPHVFANVSIPAGGEAKTYNYTSPPIQGNVCLMLPGCQAALNTTIQLYDLSDHPICESDVTNNALCSTPTIDVPNVRVNSINTVCNGNQVNAAVNISNTGCTTASVVLHLTSDCGLTFNDQTVALAACETRSILFPWQSAPTQCNCAFTASARLTSPDHECDPSDNTKTENLAITLPDMVVDSDTLTLTCTSNGTVHVNGTVTLRNNGCGALGPAAIPIRFTVYDHPGCSGTPIAQWSESPNISIPTIGGTQSVSMTHSVSGNICTLFPGCQASVKIEADVPNTICETNETNNTRCSDKTIAVPNMKINRVTASTVCTSGSPTLTVTVNVSNTGCGPVSNTVVRLTSDCGLTVADQTLSLNAGETKDIQFTSTQVPPNCTCTLTGTVDPDQAVCECDETDNTLTQPLAMTLPDIVVASESLALTCASNGTFQVAGTVTLRNAGCGALGPAAIPIRLTVYDHPGCSGTPIAQWTESVNISIPTVGGTQSVSMTHSVSGNLCTLLSGCQASVKIEADVPNTICETNETNNIRCSDKTIAVPNMKVNRITASTICTSSSPTFTATVNVSNTGCGPVSNTIVRLTSDCGLTFADQTVSLNAGETKDILFTSTQVPPNCSCTVTGTVDPNQAVCECDETDNALTQPITGTLPDITVDSESLALTCHTNGTFDVAGTVTLRNAGCGALGPAAIPIRFTVYDHAGCSGTPIAQWTESPNISIPTVGGTQSVSMTHSVSGNICTLFSGCQASVKIEADVPNTICETNETNNTRCSDKTIAVPNLTINRVTAPTGCDKNKNTDVITVNVSNTGCGPVTDAVIRVSSDCGLTFTDQRLSLTAGETRDVVFTLNAPPTACACTFTAIADPDHAICECDETDNSGTATMSIPDIAVESDTLTITCTDDGKWSVSGTVTLRNRCGALTADIAMRFTVFDQTGCTGNPIGQWTETFSNISIPGSGTHAFTLTPHAVSTASCAASIFVEVDYANTICETNETNNSWCVDQTIACTDLEAEKMTADTVCRSNGTIAGTLAVTVRNRGETPVSRDFLIRVEDGKGWSAEKYYNANLGGTLPLEPGASFTVHFDWNRDFTKKPYICDFNSITALIDSKNSICESNPANNRQTTATHLPYPDLLVKSLSAPCLSDGYRQLQAVIQNDGCGDQRDDFNISFSIDNGQKRTVSFTAVGGTLPLTKGQSQTVMLDRSAMSCTGGSVTYHVSLSSAAKTCDLTPSNNSARLTLTPNEPDLVLDRVDWQCNANGSITFTVSASNTGSGNAPNVQFIVYGPDSAPIHTERIHLAQGQTERLTFTSGIYPKGQNLSFRFVLDEENAICECNGANNEQIVMVNCPPPTEVPKIEITKVCPSTAKAGTVIQYQIRIVNSGGTDLSHVTIDDYLPEGFAYVSDSSMLAGVKIDDPKAGSPMTWPISDMTQGSSLTLIFSVAVNADLAPETYCNEAQASAEVKGNPLATVSSERVRCCTAVTPAILPQCCLKIDERLLSPLDHRPVGPVSVIEPYFTTESAMFAVYAALNLWTDTPLEKESMPLFMKERLQNYALSTIEEFYLGSKLGLTLPDGSLWLAYAGAYPYRKDEDRNSAWTRDHADDTLNASQLGFELLALNAAMKVETRDEIRRKLDAITRMKLDFLGLFIDDLPHAWKIKEKKEQVDVKHAVDQSVRIQDPKAGLYDAASLYWAMIKLRKSGYPSAEAVESKLRAMLNPIDNAGFDPQHADEEFLFILALLENGQTDQARAKITDFDTHWTKDTPLNNLRDVAMAAAVDVKAGGTAYPAIKKQMMEKYYLKDMGILADLQPDFTFKLSLEAMAALTLCFDATDATDPTEREDHAAILYRSFDDAGLFLKKRNIVLGNPLQGIVKNNAFSEPLLPFLTVTRAKDNVVPVFSQEARVHSPQANPRGEMLMPYLFSKILSTGYEPDVATIASLSFQFQYAGRRLAQQTDRVTAEEGRSIDVTGKRYVDSLLHSRAGLIYQDLMAVPFESLAVKGSGQGDINLEPLDSRPQFATKTFADYLLAETYYVQGNGKTTDRVKDLLKFQARIVEKFQTIGYVPESFHLFLDPKTDALTLIPSKAPASRATIARLYHVFRNSDNRAFFQSALAKARGALSAEDLVFLSAAPELVSYFKNEIKQRVDRSDARVSDSAADVLGRRLLGESPALIARSIKNLERHWDKDAVLPKSDLIEHIEKGLIYHHQPRQLLLFILASNDGKNFRLSRTLNVLTHLLENDWGIAATDDPDDDRYDRYDRHDRHDRRFYALPSKEYLVFREAPRVDAEPGDVLTFKVTIDNRCPQGKAYDIPSLHIKADFLPPLIDAGTEKVNGLEVREPFHWLYTGLTDGSSVEFTYKAIVPSDVNFNFNSIEETIRAYGVGTSFGMTHTCEDMAGIKPLTIVPLAPLRGVVFEDRNANGFKDVGESGIPNILLKDTRGRWFRSDAEGRFEVLAGNDHEGVQLELKSLPSRYLLVPPGFIALHAPFDYMRMSDPTRLVNRRYQGEIYFGLIPCQTLTGFVYVDENGNNAYDEGEIRPSGVVVTAKDKEAVTENEGNFTFHNLPEIWSQELTIKDLQVFYKGDRLKLKLKLTHTK